MISYDLQSCKTSSWFSQPTFSQPSPLIPTNMAGSSSIRLHITSPELVIVSLGETMILVMHAVVPHASNQKPLLWRPAPISVLCAKCPACIAKTGGFSMAMFDYPRVAAKVVIGGCFMLVCPKNMQTTTNPLLKWSHVPFLCLWKCHLGFWTLFSDTPWQTRHDHFFAF